MGIKKFVLRRWREWSINTKFTVAFDALLALIVLVGINSYAALTVVNRQTAAAIPASTEIQRLVLEMDKGLENARRLQRDFLLQYPEIGFSQARDTFALQAIQQTDQVVILGSELQEHVSQFQHFRFPQAPRPGAEVHVAAHGGHRRDLLENLKDLRTADVSGMDDGVHPGQGLGRGLGQAAVGVRDDPHPESAATGFLCCHAASPTIPTIPAEITDPSNVTIPTAQVNPDPFPVTSPPPWGPSAEA